MIKRFCQELSRLVGTPNRFRYLLAVSGGADSNVMTHLFHQAGLDFSIAHCNFHLRGAESDRDMRMVQSIAEQLQVDILLCEFDTPALQRGSGISVEMMARELRYRWFEEISQPYNFIVTAHNANDALETALLNLCRGAGLKGAASIPEKNGKIIRPMLSFSANEIRQFAHNHHIQYVVDSTNADESIRRNRIRHAVVPILEELNPNLINTFSRNRAVLQQQNALYQRVIDYYKKNILTKKEDFFVLDVALIEESPDKNIILFEILKDFGFSATVVQEIRNKTSSGRHFFSPNYRLLVDRNKFVIKKREDKDQEEFYFYSVEDLTRFFNVEFLESVECPKFTKDNNILYIPLEKLHFPLMLRHWRTGDRFFPLGASGRQKVSDFFTDHKFSNFEKERVWLLCDDGEIVWIVGYRSSELYKIEKKTTYNYFKLTNYGLVWD